MPRRCLAALERITIFLVVITVFGFALERTLYAFNYVIDSNGTHWGIQDDDSPRVDTGSIRGTQEAPAGQTGVFSTSINGFGGIRVLVETSPSPYLNGEVMRGFGLTFDGVNRFASAQSIDLGGVLISRSVYVNTGANWGRWLDTFTNTTRRPLRVRVAFGGQSGTGTIGASTSQIVTTSSGDAVIAPDDQWAEYATPLNGATLVGGPQVTVIGTPDPFRGAMTFAGNWLFNDTFNSPLLYTGHERNFQAYVNTLTIPPGKSRSVLHFLVVGKRVNASTSAGERASVEATAATLAATPEVGDLSAAEICSIANFDIAAMSIPDFNYPSCSWRRNAKVDQPPAPRAPKRQTSVKYDVFEKTIAQLRAAMEAGIVTSQQLTKAYLDRIAAYDVGQFGFHAYEVLAAEDAMAQARAADNARRNGARAPLLGIPIIVKNNYDTKDMVTTNGSLTFENFQPARDAFQVAKLREAGVVIIGKGAMSEYATSGAWGNDAFGQVWNAFNPSKSSVASSSGSGSATAASLAAAAMGSQTGNSLYGPASAASLVTLRGTDGLQSGTGILPLTWMTDFGGAMTRSVSDLADMLNVLVGEDPDDPATLKIDYTKIPADWRTALDLNALQGKRIGYVDSAWADVFGSTSPPFGTNNTIDAMKSALQYLEAAGATIVQMGQLAPLSACPGAAAAGATSCPDEPPSPPAPSFAGGSIRAEGWRQYIDSHPELLTQGFTIFTEVDVDCSQRKVPYSRTDPSLCVAPQRRLTADEIQQHRDYRQITRPAGVKQWMDDANVDAVVYPGLLGDLSVNDGGAPGGTPAPVSFARRDTPSAANGVPTMVFPAGMNPQGQPINIQLMGRAWDDAKLLGFAYAFEHYATLAGDGHQVQTTAPALRHRKGHHNDRHNKYGDNSDGDENDGDEQ